MPKSDITWALGELATLRPQYEVYANYYGGDHKLLFATEKYRNAFGMLFQAFADNLCPTVIDSVSDRLNVDGFDGKNAAQAVDMWASRKLQRSSNQLHRDALRAGDTYLLVWPDTKSNVQLWPQRPTQCCIYYDDEVPGLAKYAAKVWRTKDDHVRATLYYPDHIERYVTLRTVKSGWPRTAQAFGPYAGDEAGPVVENQWGVVPLFHFANADELGTYGRSELADVIPLQDALNKSVTDMLVAMEFHAYPQRWVTGLQVEIDPDTGKPKSVPFTPAADRVWSAGGENVKFGQFPAAELKGYLEAQESFRKEIARVSGVPLHYLNLASQYPSGEALKISEGRLVKKVEDRQINFGDTWAAAMNLALAMDGNDVSVVDPDPEQLKIIWRSAAPYNPLLDAETLLVKEQVGISQRQALREMGYTDEQIDQMDDEKIEEALMALSAVMPTGTFTRNGSNGQPSKPAPGQQGGPPQPGAAGGALTGLRGKPLQVTPVPPKVSSRIFGEYDEP